ncbi:hypothetical protein [Paenibacillus tengchongensis]|uniref:hypothetical protein n=1 Tax=Paenibacillus tengchongensis TaxID=2608684 RepID=UPI00124D0807|nr:hypothetical protein [Paenibacillus tengchongensis]
MKVSRRFMVMFMALMLVFALTATAASASTATVRERGVTYYGTVNGSEPSVYLFPNTTANNATVTATVTTANPALIKAEYYFVNNTYTVFLGTMAPPSMTGGTSYLMPGWSFMVKITSLAPAGTPIPFGITFN